MISLGVFCSRLKRSNGRCCMRGAGGHARGGDGRHDDRCRRIRRTGKRHSAQPQKRGRLTGYGRFPNRQDMDGSQIVRIWTVPKSSGTPGTPRSCDTKSFFSAR
jgi:hypothetical protein